MRGLKDALARGQVADARGQAVARAALSYALFVKTLSTPPEAGELKGMLEKGAREHARAARTADPGFRPQAPLFPGAFADFFARQ